MAAKKPEYKITHWIQIQCMEDPAKCGWHTCFWRDDEAGNNSAIGELEDHVKTVHQKKGR